MTNKDQINATIANALDAAQNSPNDFQFTARAIRILRAIPSGNMDFKLAKYFIKILSSLKYNDARTFLLAIIGYEIGLKGC